MANSSTEEHKLAGKTGSAAKFQVLQQNSQRAIHNSVHALNVYTTIWYCYV